MANFLIHYQIADKATKQSFLKALKEGESCYNIDDELLIPSTDTNGDYMKKRLYEWLQNSKSSSFTENDYIKTHELVDINHWLTKRLL